MQYNTVEYCLVSMFCALVDRTVKVQDNFHAIRFSNSQSRQLTLKIKSNT